MSTTAPSRCSTCGVELVGGVRAAPGVQADAWIAIYVELREAMFAGDWQRVGRVFRSDFRFVSRQRGLAYETVGRDERVAALSSRYDRRTDGLFEILAAKGRASLVRFHAFSEGDEHVGPWDVARISVNEIDDEGNWASGEAYDEDDIERARARFEEISTERLA